MSLIGLAACSSTPTSTEGDAGTKALAADAAISVDPAKKLKALSDAEYQRLCEDRNGLARPQEAQRAARQASCNTYAINMTSERYSSLEEAAQRDLCKGESERCFGNEEPFVDTCVDMQRCLGIDVTVGQILDCDTAKRQFADEYSDPGLCSKFALGTTISGRRAACDFWSQCSE